MPIYPQHSADIQDAAAVYRQDSRFLPAYEDDYLQNLNLALQELVLAPWLYTTSNRRALTRQPLDNYHFAADFAKLNRARIFKQPLFDALIPNIQFSAELTDGFLTLNEGNILWLPGNIDALKQKPKIAGTLAQGFVALRQAELFNPATRSLLLQFPQLIPSIVLFQKRGLLNPVSLSELTGNVANIDGLTAVFMELECAEALNEYTYRQVLSVAPQNGKLLPAVRELRQTGLLKANFSTLLEKMDQLDALTAAFFNFNYAEVPLLQEDLNLLFKFAPQAEPLSLVMIYLGHLNLLKTYRSTLSELGQQAPALLRLFEILMQKGIFEPDNLIAVFKQIHSLDHVLCSCEAHPALTQPEFDKLLGRIQAERRLGLLLGSSGLGAGKTVGPQFFGLKENTLTKQGLGEHKTLLEASHNGPS